MPSAIVTATLQSTFITFCSCMFTIFFLQKTPPTLPLLIFTLLSTPPNFLWQQYLERVFPGYSAVKLSLSKDDKEVKSEKKLNVRNTFSKFALDQTLGALVNVAAFLGGVRLLRGFPAMQCWEVVKDVCITEFPKQVFMSLKEASRLQSLKF